MITFASDLALFVFHYFCLFVLGAALGGAQGHLRLCGWGLFPGVLRELWSGIESEHPTCKACAPAS